MSCYSLDLRTKVIEYLEKGNSVHKTSETFGIAMRTIFYWKALYKRSVLKPKNNKIRKHRKLQASLIEDYILKHPEKTVQQIAEHFNVWYQTIYYRIQKLNFTYKKKNYLVSW